VTLVVEAFSFRVVWFRYQIGISGDTELISRRSKPPGNFNLAVLAELL
jgi:hypothetical protein